MLDSRHIVIAGGGPAATETAPSTHARTIFGQNLVGGFEGVVCLVFALVRRVAMFGGRS
jgi:hypothetical protein